ncbi:MAG: hypothetical protein Q9202_003230 [Teloschistes flavicans]
MASLLIFGGITLYEKYQSRRRSKHPSPSSPNHPTSPSFATLEKANAERIAALQQNTCFCARSDWAGEGCAVHDRERFEAGLRRGMEAVVREEGGLGEGGEAEGEGPPAYEAQPSPAPAQANRNTRAAAARGRRGGGGARGEGDGNEEEEPLVVPDVGHVMPPRYEDVHDGEKPCKRTLKERILRRKGGCAREGMVVR